MQENTPEPQNPFAKYGPLAKVLKDYAMSATEAVAAAHAFHYGDRAAEPHEMACCFVETYVTDGELGVRCVRPAKWIKRDEPFVGRAYCDEHPPLKRKGNWWVPIPMVRIER